MKTILLGQAPGREGDGEPLSGRSGRRLASLCGLTMEQYLATFERMNLVDEHPGSAGKGDEFFTTREVRELAERLRDRLTGRRVVVLGFVNAAGFGLTQPAFVFAPHWEGEFAFSPHPSGVNLWWNDSMNVLRARRFFRELVSGPGSTSSRNCRRRPDRRRLSV